MPFATLHLNSFDHGRVGLNLYACNVLFMYLVLGSDFWLKLDEFIHAVAICEYG